MIFVCEKELFLNSLSLILRGVSSRSSLPILTGIKISLKGDDLEMLCSDLEISIKHKTQVEGEEDGELIFPARLLFEIFKSLPDGKIKIATENEQRAVISCKDVIYDINLLNKEDWPEILIEAQKTDISIPLDLFKSAVNKVIRSSSRDETRRVLTGVLLSLDEKKMSLVATDSYRLAISSQDLKEDIKTRIEVLIPNRVLNEAVKIGEAMNEENIGIKVNDNNIIFVFNGTLIKSRIIDGQFPDYKKLIPSESIIKIPVDRKDFTDAVRRMTVLSKNNSPLYFDMKKDQIEVGVQSSGIGKANEIIKIDYDGKEEKIAFNGSYLLDGLNNGNEKMVLEINDPQKPGVIKNKDMDDYLYLIMPVRA